ncbi:MAG: three-Cys-motif partner protein TcmP [Dehalococcoidia bacterium]|nr:MAG: three-Cys-motif partner protein TcmP [Dehalococcoidia bacterium]
MNEGLVHTPKIINKWFCHKLECFGDFIKSYSRDESGFYLEPFASGGVYTCKGTDCLTEGAELRSLKDSFLECIFLANDINDARNLKKLISKIDTKSVIINGNCINDKILRQAFDLIPRSAKGFCFIDPPGYNRLRWSTIKNLSAHGKDWHGHKMDLLIIFPLEMALLRNITRSDCEASINRLYGNRDWQQVRQRIQNNSIVHSEARKKLVSLYKTSLKSLDYRYVEDIKPARFSRPPNYHLFWTSDNRNRVKELTELWTKPRYLPCELFSNTGNKEE